MKLILSLALLAGLVAFIGGCKASGEVGQQAAPLHLQ
jgi:hypothetical protein